MVMPEVLVEGGRRKAGVWRLYMSLDYSKEMPEVPGTSLVDKKRSEES